MTTTSTSIVAAQPRLRQRAQGSVLALVGYILSPLSWWNDLILNIPLAYAFAYPFSLVSKKLFLPTMILGYWLTNVAGFIIMHHGAKQTIAKTGTRPTVAWKNNIILSLVYTALVVICMQSGWVKIPMEYFHA